MNQVQNNTHFGEKNNQLNQNANAQISNIEE